MVTLEQKLSLFKKLVDDQVQKDIDELFSQKDAEIEEYLENKKRQLEANALRTKKNTIERVKRQHAEALSTLFQANRREYLRLNEELLSELLEKTKQQARRFVESDEYPALISKTIEAALGAFDPSTALEIFVAPASFEAARGRIEALMNAQGYADYRIHEGENYFIGGFVIEDAQQTVRINRTFAEAIERSREEIGQLLNDCLKNGGKPYEQ